MVPGIITHERNDGILPVLKKSRAGGANLHRPGLNDRNAVGRTTLGDKSCRATALSTMHFWFSNERNGMTTAAKLMR